MNFLEARAVDFISKVKTNRQAPFDFALLVSADRVGSRVGKGRTSHRQMNRLKGEIKKQLGFEIEWIVMPGQQAADLEAALLQLLETRYPGFAKAAYISSLGTEPVSVWIETTPNFASTPALTAVDALIKEFLKLYGIESTNLFLEGGEDLPSKPMILRSLKVHAPVTTDHLAEVLRSGGSDIPNSRWLQAKLDSLRKQGFVLRSNKGEYSPTELGLSVVPYGKYRSSSDVERALAFGKREW
jgi:hypothetical protein